MQLTRNFTQAIQNMKAIHIVGKTGSTLLFGLALVIVYQLINHGQTALGAYMLIEQLLEKFHFHGGGKATAHAVHITAHETKSH